MNSMQNYIMRACSALCASCSGILKSFPIHLKLVLPWVCMVTVRDCALFSLTERLTRETCDVNVDLGGFAVVPLHKVVIPTVSRFMHRTRRGMSQASWGAIWDGISDPMDNLKLTFGPVPMPMFMFLMVLFTFGVCYHMVHECSILGGGGWKFMYRTADHPEY